MDYENLDPSGSLMEKIQALIQPPQSEDAAKKAKKNEKEPRKAGGAVNHDLCDSCGEGGDLLCCDSCPCAFHLSCCDPPLEEDEIPPGEWLCNECRADPKKSYEENAKVVDGKQNEVPEKKDKDEHRERIKERRVSNNDSPFETLVKMSAGKNPKTFSLPPELKCNTIFPGDRKRKNSVEEKAPPAKNGKRQNEEEEIGTIPARFCFSCTRSELKAPLLQCDFCPLAFHLDCLSPPMTTIPSGMWMCPNHAEHAEPGLRAPRFSKRVQAYDDLRNNVSQHTVKMDFLQKVHRLRNHPGNKHKREGSRRKAVTVVPKSIKDHYSYPPIKLLPPHIQKMQHPLPQYSLPLQGPTTHEQEEWLKAVIELQCGIATHMTQLTGIKAQTPTPSPDINPTTVKTTAQTTAGSSNGTASSIDTTNTLTCAVLAPGSSGMTTSMGKFVPGVVKSVLPNHVNTSSVSSQCFNKVITTTITTTSGGKTVTKPVTILYASPAKSNAQMNGHITNAVKVIPTTSTTQIKGATGTPVMKHEPKNLIDSKAGIIKQTSLDLKSNQTNLIDCKKLVNDLHMNNVIKPKVEPGKTVHTNNSAAKAVVVSGSQIVGQTGKNIAGTPTKLIVLTSTGGNIIKTIPTCSPITTTAVTPLSVTSSGHISPGKVTVSGNNPTQRIVLTSSPSRTQQVSVIPAAMTTANAINTLCASTGGDGLQVTELAKLDPRLIQVLAYQRLQQLLTQTKPVPPSPAASTKRMTFNGLKETFVLPQQSVQVGKSIAVICPLNGVGPVYPMLHRSVTIGKGSDKDICLSSYGHCNFISERHSCIFYDDVTKQYELLNYSEHGTYVDNVLYSCDFSDKPTRQIISTKNLDSSKVNRNKLLEASRSKQNSKSTGVRCTSGLSVQSVTRPCNCSASSSSLIGGSGAGWEGTALLHHGSYIKVGCIQFVFSIVSHTNKGGVKSQSAASTVTSQSSKNTATPAAKSAANSC